jgi:ABC-type Fe3+ transport system substrate-binding protein
MFPFWRSSQYYVVDIMYSILIRSQDAGSDAENDPLLNPAYALVGKHAQNKKLADEFVDWLVSWSGGQRVIERFEAGRVRVYSKAPTVVTKQYSAPFTPPHSPSRSGKKFI